jgi:hypothetical protein
LIFVVKTLPFRDIERAFGPWLATGAQTGRLFTSGRTDNRQACKEALKHVKAPITSLHFTSLQFSSLHFKISKKKEETHVRIELAKKKVSQLV